MRHVTCEECGTFYRRLQSGKVLPCPTCAEQPNFSAPARKCKYTPLHLCWQGIKRRCFNESEPSYPDYGGRGITVCDRWANSFEAFKQDMGPRPPGYTIERVDNDGDYEPGNCIWATMHTQSRNKRSNVRVSLRGRTQILTDWCNELGIALNVVKARLRIGWSYARALETPVKSIRNRNTSPAREAALGGAQKPQV